MQGLTNTARVMKRRGCDVPHEGFQPRRGGEKRVQNFGGGKIKHPLGGREIK